MMKCTTHLRMVAHAGTHVDAARHFFPEGESIDEYPIGRFVCRGASGCPDRLQKLADLVPEALAVARQRLRRRQHL